MPRRVAKTVPFQGSFPHHEHRSKKGQQKHYGAKRRTRIMKLDKQKKADRKWAKYEKYKFK